MHYSKSTHLKQIRTMIKLMSSNGRIKYVKLYKDYSQVCALKLRLKHLNVRMLKARNLRITGHV
ncbi:Uncharacterised protein [Acinetobacter baumannii]|nr:Uncharacterised protein [Acinetobacter baumannii]